MKKERQGIFSEYVYDYQDQRVIKQVDNSGTLQKTFYVSGIYEIRNDEHLKYVTFQGKRLALIKGKIHEEIYAIIKGVRLDNYKVFYISDHLGSTNIATDTEGNVLEIIEYYPYSRIRLILHT